MYVQFTSGGDIANFNIILKDYRSYIPPWNIQLHQKRWIWRRSCHFFVGKSKKYKSLLFQFFVFEILSLKMFLICFYFFSSFSCSVTCKLHAWNFIIEALWHGHFPHKFWETFRRNFLQSICKLEAYLGSFQALVFLWKQPKNRYQSFLPRTFQKIVLK